MFSHRALPEDSPPPSGRSLGSCHADLRSPNAPWALSATAREPLVGARPGVTAPLATPLAPCLQDPQGAGEALCEAGGVAVCPVGVVGPPARGLQPRHQPAPPPRSVRLTPGGEALPGVPSLRPRGPASERVLPRPILPPAQRAPPKLAAGLRGRAVPTARAHPRLLRRPLPSAWPSPRAPRLVAAVRLGLMRTRPHTIVRVSDQARCASPAPLDPGLEPPLPGLGPIPLGQDRGEAPPGRGPRRWRQHLALRVQPPGGEPRLEQPPQGSVREALCPHPAPPLVLEGVEDAAESRFAPPGVSPPWPLDRPWVSRVHGPNRWPLSLAPIAEILLVEGGEQAPEPTPAAGRSRGHRVPSDRWARALFPLPRATRGRLAASRCGAAARARPRIDAVRGRVAALTPAVLGSRLLAPSRLGANPLPSRELLPSLRARSGRLAGGLRPSCPPRGPVQRREACPPRPLVTALGPSSQPRGF